jgi:anti-sigma factor RsiW
MKNDCGKWKEKLLEAALTGTAAGGLGEHLLTCAGCAEELAELRAKRERLEALLSLVAQGTEPGAGFAGRVLATAEAAEETKRGQSWRVWAWSSAIAVMATTIVVGLALHWRTVGTAPGSELEGAKKLAEWRAPSDVLLETPGREIMWKTPKLGESYLHVSEKSNEEE